MDKSGVDVEALSINPYWYGAERDAVAALIRVQNEALAAAAAAHPGRITAVGAVALVTALVWFVVPFLRWQTTTYQLTSRRLRLRRGILSRSGRDFPLIRISDVSFSHGLIDRMLGCGQLVVESAGEHGQLVLTEIPQVEQVQATLFQLVEDEHARLAREEHEA